MKSTVSVCLKRFRVRSFPMRAVLGGVLLYALALRKSTAKDGQFPT
jgi:hypothetical protein